MGLIINEFVASRDRNRVSLGEPFEVQIECSWDPLSAGGSEFIALSCEQTGFDVRPAGLEVSVDPDGGVTTKRFRIAISGPGGELVDVVAAAASGSTDSFIVRAVSR